MTTTSDPAESFAPALVPDTTAYRNLALRRPAYHSSSRDYNLTAQLVTDGIPAAGAPRWLATATSQRGLLPKQEREYPVDHNSTSTLDMDGPKAWVQIELRPRGDRGLGARGLRGAAEAGSPAGAGRPARPRRRRLAGAARLPGRGRREGPLAAGRPDRRLAEAYLNGERPGAVRYHRDMNFTMIRNWVGQTGDDEFYEACDRHGIGRRSSRASSACRTSSGTRACGR